MDFFFGFFSTWFEIIYSIQYVTDDRKRFKVKCLLGKKNMISHVFSRCSHFFLEELIALTSQSYWWVHRTLGPFMGNTTCHRDCLISLSPIHTKLSAILSLLWLVILLLLLQLFQVECKGSTSTSRWAVPGWASWVKQMWSWR